jgi:hypothetical protein
MKLLATGVLCFASVAFAQTGRYPDARGLVEHVQIDLKQAADFSRKNGKQMERFDNAEKHLSEFDRHLNKGKFDKGKLDVSIGDVKNVIDHNTLTPELRDALQNDIRELRLLRADRAQ